MSGIAGIFCADGRPADAAELRPMASALQHRAPDGTTYWHAGPIGFAHMKFCTTPESLHESQPLPDPSGETCLVWDGRLDHREELREAIVSRGGRLVDNTDPGLVLSAYLVWGKECVARLLGDFAFAVWDGRLRQLLCARDYGGFRPFNYFWDGTTFLFASEIRALLANPRVSLKINEGMVGEYLLESIASRNETLYLEIQRIPAGAFLTISASNDLRIENYWKPDLSPIRYQTDDQYAEHFVRLLEESVRCCIRCCGAWGSYLSGGLDSSTVSVTAQALLNRAGSGQRVSTFSVAEPGRPWDESEYISEISQFAGLRSEWFPAPKVDLNYFQQSAAWSRDFPGYPNGKAMFIRLSEAVQQRGVKVLLTGLGGNHLLEGHAPHLLDLARSGDFRRLVQSAKDDWQIYGGRTWLTFLLRILAGGYAPNWIRSGIRKRRLRRHGLLSRDFVKRTQLADRLHSQIKPDSRAFSSRAQEAIFLLISSATEAHYFETGERDAARLGREERHPLFDRRLAEFCLRMPEDQRQRGTTWKWVLRNATRGRLPERVRTKTVQAEFNELFTTVVSSPAVQERLRNLTMLKHTDWLDKNGFHRRFGSLGRWLPAAETDLMPWPTWMILGIDLWLDDLTSRTNDWGSPTVT